MIGETDLVARLHGRKQYARDFSELSEGDLLSLVSSMVRIGRAASEKARTTNLRAARRLVEKEDGL